MAAKAIPPPEVALRRILVYYSGWDDELLPDLVKLSKRAKRRGYYTKPEFMAVCERKSARPRHLFNRNSDEFIRATTAAVLKTSYEKRRMQKLDDMWGVNIPVAACILTSIDPKIYGFIDIRDWQALYWLGVVKRNPRGRDFSIDDWLQFLYRMRYWARRLKVTVRRLEICLYWFHGQFLQRGALYDKAQRPDLGLTPAQRRKLSWLLD